MHFRYGREEMLALYDKNLRAPDSLVAFRTLYSESALLPLALAPNTDEEVQRKLWICPVSSKKLQTIFNIGVISELFGLLQLIYFMFTLLTSFSQQRKLTGISNGFILFEIKMFIRCSAERVAVKTKFVGWRTYKRSGWAYGQRW